MRRQVVARHRDCQVTENKLASGHFCAKLNVDDMNFLQCACKPLATVSFKLSLRASCKSLGMSGVAFVMPPGGIYVEIRYARYVGDHTVSIVYILCPGCIDARQCSCRSSPVDIKLLLLSKECMFLHCLQVRTHKFVDINMFSS